MEMAKEMIVRIGTSIVSPATKVTLAQADESSSMFAASEKQNQNQGRPYHETDFMQRPVKQHMKVPEKLMDG
jgi:hypothetical protein